LVNLFGNFDGGNKGIHTEFWWANLFGNFAGKIKEFI
jgi:hypothetical protein